MDRRRDHEKCNTGVPRYPVYSVVHCVYFENDPGFVLMMKSSDRLTVVLGLLVRVLRGVIMAFAIYPFGDITDGCGLDRFRILMGKRDRNN